MAAVRRALLIGAASTNLKGVENDVAAMAAALGRRGFTSRRCTGEDATRARILQAYEQLIEEAEEDDAIVVFFSGHGGHAPAPEPDGFALQYIVPNDYGESTEGDFRGIASVELSVLQARLAAKTRNVTAVFDCCHAGRLGRRGQVKRVDPGSYAMVKAHLDRLEAAGLPVGSWRNEGSRHVVRVVACAPWQRAVEYRNDQGAHVGLLTESLVLALGEAERHSGVTWAAVMDRVRSRVVGKEPLQRPDVEGPADRCLFEAVTADLLMSLPVVPLDESGLVHLECAALLGVQEGDGFMIMPAGAKRADEASRIGGLTVGAVTAVGAEGRVELPPGKTFDSGTMSGARAFRIRSTAPRIRVRIPVDDPRTAGLVATLAAGNPLVEVVPPGESDWTAEVRVEPDGSMTLCDRIGPLHPPRTDGSQTVDEVSRGLKVLAQAAQLRRLAGSPWHALNAAVDVEWGQVVDGERRPLNGDAVLCDGDRDYVRVDNRGPVTVYVSMIDIGVSGRISLLTRGAPSGWEVGEGQSYTFGEDRRAGVLTGARVSWPEGLDPQFGRSETILVFVTSAPQDLRALQQPDVTRKRSRSRWVSPLQDMIDQLATGKARREVEPEGGPDSNLVRYDIHAFSFEVRPSA